MIIKKIDITGLRALKRATLEFAPGMNLIVGVNGVGKTTILDAIRIALSAILPEITAYKGFTTSFLKSDILVGADGLQLSVDFLLDQRDFNLLIVKQHDKNKVDQEGVVRAQTFETPDIVTISPSISDIGKALKISRVQPVGIFFSTKRSLMINHQPRQTAAAGGQAAAFSEALSDKREFNLRTFAQWYHVQQELSSENPVALKHLSALTGAIKNFLPEFDNLHVADTDGNFGFVIEKNGVPLFLWQLSDGERGVLSLVMDIARRLSQANPELDNPVKDGVAVILIDELDLHLHPKWQRMIVKNLTDTFQNCQFIATTHSPQIIPALEPARITLVKNNQTIRPERSLGMDSNWLLRHLMGGDDRPADASEAIVAVEDLILATEFEEARNLIGKFRAEGFDLQEWSILEARIARLEVIDDEE